MAELATLKTRLSEAEAALHNAMKSGGVVEYRQADGRFVRRDAAELRLYITDLRAQIASAAGGARTLAEFGAAR